MTCKNIGYFFCYSLCNFLFCWLLCNWLQVGGTQEGQAGTAESVLTEDGVDVAASDNMVLRKLLVSAQVDFLYLSN
jgi:hypothetical protein